MRPPAIFTALPALLLLLLSAAAATAAPARAADSITWLMADFPPVGEPVNGRPGNGIADQVVKYLAHRWPQASHRFLYANPNRVWSMLAAGEQACFASALRTPERDKLAYFRNAYLLPPPQLVVRPEALPAIPRNARGEADLPALMRDSSLRGLLVETRSYGQAIDALLADHTAGWQVKRLAPGNYGTKILTMLALNRADYTIEMDFVITHALAQDAGLASLKVLPLAGDAAALVGGIACPRTPWGRAAIRHIDALLATPEGVAVLARAQERWMSKQSSQRYGPQMKEFMRRMAAPQRPD